ncbi:MAG: orotidine-5'-phosphate decarboxylase [Oscillospiraceae bacterium]|nr:orotidine-5'-phosphate decarboxylase [Oscillospiraceae bacterium]
MNIDKLFKNVAKNGVVCLGLDTSPAYIPEEFKKNYGTPGKAVFAFNKKLIDATHDVVACYKVQIAYYEALGLDGLAAYAETLKYIKSVGQLVIADIKRGDIKETAEMYAKAHFSGDFEADFVTLNPYMGMDTLEPFEPYFAKGKGCFALMRTSNTGSFDIQYLTTDIGKKVYEIVGEKLQKLGKKYMGECGYSSVGAVMGATNTDEIKKLREMLATTFLLIPGFGAQGGSAGDAALFLKDGNGGVVNSSRAILTAYKKHPDGSERFEHYAREETVRMRDAIGGCL